MLLQVDGWFGSGKGVLYTLLDGHPDVFCSPVHDYSYAAFLGQSNDLDWIQTKHTEILRKALARTQYFKFEKVYWDGFMSFDFAAGKVLKIPYSLDYYQFDREFFKAMVEKDTWTLEDMIDTLYGSVFMAAKGKESFDGKALWFASPSNALFVDEYENIPQIFPNGKSIQVRRSVEKIIATRSNRKPRPEDFKTWSFFVTSSKKE